MQIVSLQSFYITLQDNLLNVLFYLLTTLIIEHIHWKSLSRQAYLSKKHKSFRVFLKFIGKCLHSCADQALLVPSGNVI